MTSPPTADTRTVLVPFQDLLTFTADLFHRRGMPQTRAQTAANALCYGDLHGVDSHGLFNLTRLYLPLFDNGRVDPAAEPQVLSDLGASLTVDARRALGLWYASEAMDTALERAARHGVGLVAVRNGTHFGCAGHHTKRAAERGMIGVLAGNCGGQRIARPPHARPAMLGTNPLSVAAPAVAGHPFVLDMSTTAVPTGKVRTAASRGVAIPEGWLEDHSGAAVTDPAALDRGEGFLTWLGGGPEAGGYKGFGLALAVEVLAALVPGAAVGPAPEALDGDGTPQGRDDDIGFFVLAIAPDLMHPEKGFAGCAESLFGTLLRCPPRPGGGTPSYPGWPEAQRARERLRHGVPLSAELHRDLVRLGLRTGGSA